MASPAHSPSPARTRGVTLLDLLTGLAVGTVVLGGISALFLVSRTSSAETLTITKGEYGAKLSVLKIENEVIESSAASPDWSLANGATAESLTFNRCLGSRDGSKVWSEPITYHRDGNLLVRRAEGLETLVAERIQGLAFTLRDQVLTVAVTSRGENPNRFSYEAVATLDVGLRN
jgi:hypothetical protein